MDIVNILKTNIVNSLQNNSTINNNLKQSQIKNIENLNSNTDYRSLFSTSVTVNQAVETGIEELFKLLPEYMYGLPQIEYDLRIEENDISVPYERETKEWREFVEGEYKNISFTTPVIREKNFISKSQLLKRQFSQNIYEMTTPESLLLSKIVHLIITSLNRIKRQMRWQAYNALAYAKIDFSKISDTKISEDFKRDPELTTNVTTPWSDPTSDIIADLTAVSSKMEEIGKGTPNMLILGSNAIHNFNKNDGINKILDNRKKFLGEVKPSESVGGNYSLGTIFINGRTVTIYGVKGFFRNPLTKAKEKYIDPDYCILLDTDISDLRTYFGAIEQFQIDGGDVDLNMDLTTDMNNPKVSIKNLNLMTSNVPIYVSSFLDQTKHNLCITVESAPFLTNSNPNATALLITKM